MSRCIQLSKPIPEYSVLALCTHSFTVLGEVLLAHLQLEIYTEGLPKLEVVMEF